MENNFNDQFQNDLAPLPPRPQFLKVLCILSFICCGMMILIYALGTICLGMSEETINNVWEKVVASQPQLENVDPVEFFRQAGKLCLYNLFANIISLAGVIMMWRLNKTGFFIYAIAELATNFLGMGMNIEGSDKNYGSIILWVIIDLIFIIMYAVNLKHMNGNKQTQSTGI